MSNDTTALETETPAPDGAIWKNEEAETANAFGKPLTFYKSEDGEVLVPSGKLTYFFKCLEFKTVDAVKKANMFPDNGKLLKMLNANIKAEARGKAQAQAWKDAGIKQVEMKDSPEMQLETMKKVFIAKGYSEEKALKLALRAIELEAEDGE